jgi:type II secretory pathway pseudopilin PulG
MSGDARGRRRGGNRRCAFTLIELLTVTAMLTVLLGLLAPSIRSVRAESRSVACMAHLKQIFAAVEAYRQQHSFSLPNCLALPALTPEGPEGGLTEALDGFIEKSCECWICSGDYSGESEQIGTSYFYTPGLLILSPIVQIQMPLDAPTMPEEERMALEARLVTAYFEGEGKDTTPILFDAGDYHDYGTRSPRNGLYIDGTVRIAKQTSPPQTP